MLTRWSWRLHSVRTYFNLDHFNLQKTVQINKLDPNITSNNSHKSFAFVLVFDSWIFTVINQNLQMLLLLQYSCFGSHSFILNILQSQNTKWQHSTNRTNMEIKLKIFFMAKPEHGEQHMSRTPCIITSRPLADQCFWTWPKWSPLYPLMPWFKRFITMVLRPIKTFLMAYTTLVTWFRTQTRLLHSEKIKGW